MTTEERITMMDERLGEIDELAAILDGFRDSGELDEFLAEGDLASIAAGVTLMIVRIEEVSDFAKTLYDGMMKGGLGHDAAIEALNVLFFTWA